MMGGNRPVWRSCPRCRTMSWFYRENKICNNCRSLIRTLSATATLLELREHPDLAQFEVDMDHWYV